MNPVRRRISLLLIGVLLVLQGCDLLFTWRLLSGARPDVYEANPLAAALLEHFGWASLALLKVGTSALILLAVVVVARQRPALACRLLGGLCLFLGSVVGYSGWLLGRPVDPLVQEMPTLNARNLALDRQIGDVARFARKRKVICTDTMVGRTDLAAGVKRLRECIIEAMPKLSTGVRKHLPATDRTDEVAAFLYYHASRLVHDGQAQESDLARLEQHLGRLYPTAPVWDFRVVSAMEPFPWGSGRTLVSANVPDAG
jgi:hypothetical protein